MGIHGQQDSMHYRTVLAVTKGDINDSPTVFKTYVNNLSVAFEKQGQYKEAEACNRLALGGRAEVFGQNCPKTLISVDNMGVIFFLTTRTVAKAEVMYHRALEGERRCWVRVIQTPSRAPTILLGSLGRTKRTKELRNSPKRLKVTTFWNTNSLAKRSCTSSKGRYSSCAYLH